MRLKRVISGIDWSRPIISYIYTLAIVIAGVFILVSSFTGGKLQPAEVLFFIGLRALAGCLQVRLPHVNGYVSVGSSISLAAIFCLGAPGAAVSASFGVLIANLFYASLPLDSILFNAGQLAVTSYISSLVFEAFGGIPGVPLSFPGDLVALLLTMIIYTTINVSLVTMGIGLDLRKPFLKIWLDSIKWSVPNYTCLGPLGILAAEIYYSSLSMYGILLLWIPLLFARYSFQQYWEIRQAHLKTIEALALALDARDPYTSGHSERVAIYSSTMATKLKLQDNQVEQIRFAGILHDIGKIGISDFVLNKKGTLDADQYALIQSHPGIGADMIKNIGFLKEVSQLIRHHHERYDGTGYPDKLQGQAIPFGSRIIGVVDAFDAMTCDRVYRPSMTPEEAITRLTAGKGTQFDPDMVDCFIKIWELDFDNGRLAPLPARNRIIQPVVGTQGQEDALTNPL